MAKYLDPLYMEDRPSCRHENTTSKENLTEELVEVTETWIPCEESKGPLYVDKKPYKCVSIIANGKPIFVAEDVVVEIRKVHKKEVESKYKMN